MAELHLKMQGIEIDIETDGTFTELATMIMQACVNDMDVFAAAVAGVLETARHMELSFPDLCKMMIKSMQEDPTNPEYGKAQKYYNMIVTNETSTKN